MLVDITKSQLGENIIHKMQNNTLFRNYLFINHLIYAKSAYYANLHNKLTLISHYKFLLITAESPLNNTFFYELIFYNSIFCQSLSI